MALFSDRPSLGCAPTAFPPLSTCYARRAAAIHFFDMVALLKPLISFDSASHERRSGHDPRCGRQPSKGHCHGLDSSLGSRLSRVPTRADAIVGQVQGFVPQPPDGDVDALAGRSAVIFTQTVTVPLVIPASLRRSAGGTETPLNPPRGIMIMTENNLSPAMCKAFMVMAPLGGGLRHRRQGGDA